MVWWWWFESSWKSVLQQKATARQEAVLKARALLSGDVGSDRDVSVYLKATAVEITRRIQDAQWTASQVVDAYIGQAIRAHEQTNCLTEVLFEQAREQAAELDSEFKSTGKLRGPWHGVPVSFKDQFDIKGFDSCIGFTQWSNDPSTRDATLVQLFRAAGAVVIAKTNVPQTLLSFECSNPVWGRTTNPWSPFHTCGGSSGGEAALLAMSGSALGVGTDMGGSLRIPAGYCGIYSLKPTSGRISDVGVRNPDDGFEGVPVSIGPMARSVDDIELMCRSFFGKKIQSSDNLTPLPYHDVQLPPKLRFGFYTSDNFVKASPACQRAVMTSVEALRKAGHECIEINTTLFFKAMANFVQLTSADGHKTLLSHLGPDPTELSLFLATLGPRVPAFIRNLAAWIVTNIVGDAMFGHLMTLSRTSSVAEFYCLARTRDEIRQQWYSEVWNANELDGIIAPIQASPAISHKASSTLSPLAAATIIYNIVDSPVGCIPVTRVDPAKDRLSEEWWKGPGHGSKLVEGDLYQGKTPVYDPVAMKGLPVGVQVVGKSWEDEKVVAMMRVVDKALGERDFGPDAWLSRKRD